MERIRHYILDEVQASALIIRERLSVGHPDSVRLARGKVERLLEFIAAVDGDIKICGFNVDSDE